VAVIFGDVWRILSPWKALADLVAFLSRSRSLHWRVFEYPQRAGFGRQRFCCSAFSPSRSPT